MGPMHIPPGDGVVHPWGGAEGSFYMMMKDADVEGCWGADDIGGWGADDIGGWDADDERGLDADDEGGWDGYNHDGKKRSSPRAQKRGGSPLEPSSEKSTVHEFHLFVESIIACIESCHQIL